jgi:hypothetical protein
MYDRPQARRGEVCTTECSSGILKRGAGITTYLYILQRWGSGLHWNYRPIPQPAPGKAGHYSWRYSYETLLTVVWPGFLLIRRLLRALPPPAGHACSRRKQPIHRERLVAVDGDTVRGRWGHSRGVESRRSGYCSTLLESAQKGGRLCVIPNGPVSIDEHRRRCASDALQAGLDEKTRRRGASLRVGGRRSSQRSG